MYSLLRCPEILLLLILIHAWCSFVFIFKGMPWHLLPLFKTPNLIFIIYVRAFGPCVYKCAVCVQRLQRPEVYIGYVQLEFEGVVSQHLGMGKGP